MLEIILFIIFAFFLFKFVIYDLFLQKHRNSFDLYFGVPGAGKTTFCAYLAKKALKRGRKVYSNFSLCETYKYEPLKDIGVYNMEHCLLLIDEAGIDYNNRNFKSFPKTSLEYFKMHRHYDADIAFFSQDLDVDLKIRKLATRYFLIQKSFFPYFISRITIKKKIKINDEGELVDFHYFQFLSRKLIFSPVLWKLFNTVDHEILPEKNFKKWNEPISNKIFNDTKNNDLSNDFF